MLNNQKIAGYLSIASLALIGLYMIAVAINVVSRYGLNAPLAIISDMSEFLVPAALALAFPVAALSGSHLSLRFLGGFLGPRVTRWLDLLGRLATVVLLAVITWRLFHYAQYTLESSRASSLRNIPLWPVWAFVTLAMAAATLATLFAAPAETPSADKAEAGLE
ncbi:TRAP transporter small permease [Pararhodobacter sp.]|uniref:TRAP transporter small permease n=1 Tax=Pararhodobacter sp. TaxID=2127056 RepID=UPI002FDF72CC